MTILAFLRIATGPHVFATPVPMMEAADRVSEWLAQPVVGILEPGVRHGSILSDMLVVNQVRGAVTMDAHLAALAVEHGAALCTTDRDFTRFPELRVEYPLAGDRPSRS